jgi:hypothetical protein
MRLRPVGLLAFPHHPVTTQHHGPEFAARGACARAQFHSKQLGEAARKWRDLVELRRLQYIDLYRSGRWQTMYSEAEFTILMNDVLAAAKVWDGICPPAQLALDPSQPNTSSGSSRRRPAA